MGVRSSWLTLATKSWRTRSSRFRSVTSRNTAALPGSGPPSGLTCTSSVLLRGASIDTSTFEVTPSRQARRTASWRSVRRTRNSGRWPTSSWSIPSILRSASLWRRTTPLESVIHIPSSIPSMAAARVCTSSSAPSRSSTRARCRASADSSDRRIERADSLSLPSATRKPTKAASPPARSPTCTSPNAPAPMPCGDAGEQGGEQEEDDASGVGPLVHASLSGLASL